MALLGFEGFDTLTAGAIGNQLRLFGGVDEGAWRHSASVTISTNFVRGAALSASGFCAVGNNTGGNGMVFQGYSGLTDCTTMIAGCRFSVQQWITPTLSSVLIFYDNTTLNCQLALNTSKQLVFIANGVTIQTGTTVLNINAVYQIEMKVLHSITATGTYEVRINGVVELSGSGVRTAVTNAHSNGVGGFGTTPFQVGFAWDDLYLLDGTGSAPYNDFLATSTTAVRVETSLVTTNDSVTWTPLSSTNASQVTDSSGMDNDTTYNKSSASGDIDTFNHAALSNVPATIFAAQIQAAMRKDDVTNQTIRTKIITSGTVNGATKTATTIYTEPLDLYINDPFTGSAWTATTINSSKIGYEHI